MKRNIKLVTSSLVLSALLVGCGSSSSDSISNVNDETPNDITSNVTEPIANEVVNNSIESNSPIAIADSETLTGYFIDAEVEGVDYETTSGLKGTTDKNGAFKYREGDRVKLHIGNLDLGEVEPRYDGLVTPESLSNGDDEVKELLLRTLQSLDNDGDTSNGITIPDNVTTSLHNINHTNISDIETEDKLLAIDKDLALALDKDFDGHIDVDSQEAHEHFGHSMSSWNREEHENKPQDMENHEEMDSHENRPQDIEEHQYIEEHKENPTEHENKSEDMQEHQNIDNHESRPENTDEHTQKSIDINSMPTSTLTQELRDAIAYMGNEERLAYDVYHNLYDYHNNTNGIEINQLKNISERAEIKHVGIVQDIVRKYSLGVDDLSNVTTAVATSENAFEDMPSGEYDLPAIQTLYNALYEKGITSKKDALEVGCMVEVTDINDLDKYVKMAEVSNATDVIESFNVLRDGSYSHYWAFDKGLKDMNITDGCCSLGELGGVDYCHNEYPTHEHNEDEVVHTTENNTQEKPNTDVVHNNQEQQKQKGK